ncbi:hypothetical protein BMETH_2219_1 [methanotrophic bacterial endosymbiont of Bathymodiolus sp.]|nr:hypothetical protein BMETH_2219_1 [methanotrophic bacterial endosymbiont of Bathymodiolus sp.]
MLYSKTYGKRLRLNIDAFIKQYFKGIARTMPDSTNDMLTADALPIR